MEPEYPWELPELTNYEPDPEPDFSFLEHDGIDITDDIYVSQLTPSKPKRSVPEREAYPRYTDRSHYKKAGLKTKGWTDKLILDFLGKPDFYLENPRNYKYPICCYDRDRVHSIEESDEFQKAFNWRKEIGSRIKAGRSNK